MTTTQAMPKKPFVDDPWRMERRATVLASYHRHGDERRARQAARMRERRATDPALIAKEREQQRLRRLAKRGLVAVEQLDPAETYYTSGPSYLAQIEAYQRYEAKTEHGLYVEIVDYVEVLRRSGGKCGICAGSLSGDEAIEFDHKIPMSRGGPHVAENIQATHRWCNASKGAKILAVA
jgi:5-methylcytosine-specific restriction endonuclease McrA